MAYEVYARAPTRGPRVGVAHVRINVQSEMISFNIEARKYFDAIGARFVECLFDVPARRVAFRPVVDQTRHAYVVTRTPTSLICTPRGYYLAAGITASCRVLLAWNAPLAVLEGAVSAVETDVEREALLAGGGLTVT